MRGKLKKVNPFEFKNINSQSFTVNSMCMPELEDKNAECIEINSNE